MTQSTALRDLEEAAAVRVVFGGSSHNVVMTAAEALALDEDSPSLRDVAGMPLDSARWELGPLVDLCFVELGLEPATPTSPRTQALALRAESRRFLAGELSRRDFVELWGWDPPRIEGVEALLVWVDQYETFDHFGGPEPTNEAVTETAQFILDQDLEVLAHPTKRVSIPQRETPADRRPAWLSMAFTAIIFLAALTAAVVAITLTMD